jgi:hypothetical protein
MITNVDSEQLTQTPNLNDWTKTCFQTEVRRRKKDLAVMYRRRLDRRRSRRGFIDSTQDNICRVRLRSAKEIPNAVCSAGKMIEVNDV